jgi:hypothetical protein
VVVEAGGGVARGHRRRDAPFPAARASAAALVLARDIEIFSIISVDVSAYQLQREEGRTKNTAWLDVVGRLCAEKPAMALSPLPVTG